MSDSKRPGFVGWMDLTVPDAVGVRDFYQKVIGWTSSGLDMGGYEDFSMVPPDAEGAVAGICHARGGNAGIPPVWLIYITVADLDESLRQCQAGGGKVVAGPKEYAGYGRYAIIQDPAGASCALFQWT